MALTREEAAQEVAQEAAQKHMKLEALVKNAIDALDRHTYTAYMNALIALGSYFEDISHEIDIPAEEMPAGSVLVKGAATLKGETSIKDKKAVVAATLRKFYESKQGRDDFSFAMPVDKLQVIHNSLAFRAFEAAWEDDMLREKSERQLAVKADLNRSIRRKIKLGMLVLANTTHMKFVAETNKEKATKYNRDATRAILHFKTPLQKTLFVVGRIVTIAVALTFGLTNAASFLTVFGITSLAALSSAGGIALAVVAAAIFIAGAAINYLVFKKPVFNFLNNIFGKDKFFEGLLNFVDEKGEKKRLSTGRIIALGFSFILAASVGGSAAALIMVYIASLGAMAGAAAFIFPPLSMVLAAVAGLSLTALMFGSFAGILQSQDWKALFTTPFKNALKIFDARIPENKLKSEGRLNREKVVTVAFVAILAAFAFMGQVANSLAQSGSLIQLFSSFGLAGAVATGLGYAIGMGVAFLGQIPFIFESAGRAVANLATRFRDALRPQLRNTDLSIDRASLAKGTQESKIGMGAKIGGAIINAFGNGILVVAPIREILGGFFAFVSGLASGAASFCAGIASATAVPGEDDKKKLRSSDYRVRILLAGSSDAIVTLPPQRDVLPPSSPIEMKTIRGIKRPENRVFSSIIFANAARKEAVENAYEEEGLSDRDESAPSPAH